MHFHANKLLLNFLAIYPPVEIETNISLGNSNQESKFALKKKKTNVTISLVLAVSYFGIIHNFGKYEFCLFLFCMDNSGFMTKFS